MQTTILANGEARPNSKNRGSGVPRFLGHAQSFAGRCQPDERRPPSRHLRGAGPQRAERRFRLIKHQVRVSKERVPDWSTVWIDPHRPAQHGDGFERLACDDQCLTVPPVRHVRVELGGPSERLE